MKRKTIIYTKLMKLSSLCEVINLGVKFYKENKMLIFGRFPVKIVRSFVI